MLAEAPPVLGRHRSVSGHHFQSLLLCFYRERLMANSQERRQLLPFSSAITSREEVLGSLTHAQ